ncbi:MAG: hypothetical protein NC299_17940 [Lachnospiraceae bacterium]|nr:hypothetical protein [Ruminococcus sp.]MCM1277210.1 hypothetical protein [Lachnospiraceae bacterium]
MNVIDELNEMDFDDPNEEYAYKFIEIGDTDDGIRTDVRHNGSGADMFEEIFPVTTVDIGQFAVAPTIEMEINRIAKKFFGRENLESKNNDTDDSLEVSVWRLQEALKKAYELGKSSGK